jgi:hypothetical protein
MRRQRPFPEPGFVRSMDCTWSAPANGASPRRLMWWPAFASALEQHAAEGGAAGRLARYVHNKTVLVEGMRAMGFHTLLENRWLSPIIVTFHAPGHPRFEFGRFYDLIKRRGFIIYPGKLTQVDSFRIGCIGQLFEEQMRGVLAADPRRVGRVGASRTVRLGRKISTSRPFENRCLLGRGFLHPYPCREDYRSMVQTAPPVTRGE